MKTPVLPPLEAAATHVGSEDRTLNAAEPALELPTARLTARQLPLIAYPLMLDTIMPHIGRPGDPIQLHVGRANPILKPSTSHSPVTQVKLEFAIQEVLFECPSGSQRAPHGTQRPVTGFAPSWEIPAEVPLLPGLSQPSWVKVHVTAQVTVWWTPSLTSAPAHWVKGPTRLCRSTAQPFLWVPKGAHIATVDFERPLLLHTRYGAPVGQQPGTVVFTSNCIGVSVDKFVRPDGTGTFGYGEIVLPPVPFGRGQVMRCNNINFVFDFSGMDSPVSLVYLEFLDLGGFENLSVNGSAPYVGDLAAAPKSIGGVDVAVTATPVTNGTIHLGQQGTVTLRGAIEIFSIGGQEFWIDNVFANGICHSAQSARSA